MACGRCHAVTGTDFDESAIPSSSRKSTQGRILNRDSNACGGVLQVEFEYMIGVGLVSSDPPGAHYELVYYATGELDDVRGTRRFDTDRFTRDAERFTGVGLETIDRIVASEIEYLHLRGIA